MIGSFLLWTFVWLWGTCCAIGGFLLRIVFNPLVDPRGVMTCYASKAWAKGILFWMPNVKIRAEGLERLSAGEPLMLTPNHASISDMIMLMSALPPTFKFVAKSPLFYVPPLAFQLRAAGYIRAGGTDEDASKRVVEQCVKRLKQGSHVIWFPEGHRSPDLEVKRFKSGPFHVAKLAGVKVAPVAISGTRDVIANKSLRYHFTAKVGIRILEPFTVEGEPREAAKRARTEVVEALAAQQQAG